MQEFIIQGEHIVDLNSFFEYMFSLLTNSDKVKCSYSFDAYNDLLRGGFGKHKFNECITLKWYNYQFSKKMLGLENILKILEITLDCDESNHNVKLELY